MDFNDLEILNKEKKFKIKTKKNKKRKNNKYKKKFKKQIWINKFKGFKKYIILIVIVILFSFIIFIFFKIFKFKSFKSFPNLNKNELVTFLKEIELKNEEYENNNLTTLIIKNRIEKLKMKKRNNINFNYIDILNISKTYNSLYKISSYANDFVSFSLTENNIKNFNISINPIISIIITVYNSQNYIINLLNSIQRESLIDIEIIYIDDCSTGNTTQIIQNLQKKDQRIILLKNKKNRGEFYSRNKGAMFSRGEYLIFIDSDDLIVDNILIKAYKTAKDNNIDVVQFKTAIRKLSPNRYNIFYEMINKNIIYQPELSDQMYYGKGRLGQVYYFLFNKIIRNEIFLESLIYIGDDYLKENIYTNEDVLQLFAVLRVANSFKFIDDIGYIKMHYERKASQSSSINKKKNINRILHDNFLELQFFFYKTKNNTHDKAICLEFLKMNKDSHSFLFSYITQGFEFIEKVFDLLLKSEYFTTSQIAQIKKYKKNIMINRKNNGTTDPIFEN